MAIFFVLAIVYRVQETRQLTGIVRDAESQSPIADVKITVAGYTATSNAQGEYTVSIPRGVFTLVAQADGYATAQAPVDGSELFARTFSANVLLSPNRVSIGVRDADSNQPLSNFQLQISNKSVTTTAQGKFELRMVKNGTPLGVLAPGYQPLSFVFEGQPEIEFALTPITLNVIVNDQYTKQPIGKAQVQAADQTVTTDAQGRVSLRRVKVGISLRTSAAGYEAANAFFSGNDITVTLRPNTLDGVITDIVTGKPISGATVLFANSAVDANALGAFHLDNVPTKATLMIRAPGYRRTPVDVINVTKREIKLTPFAVKGIHIPFAAPPEHVREMMDWVTKTELNAIVLDVKSERGRIAWESQVPLAKQISAPQLIGIDLAEVIERCRSRNIYCIARLPVFQDTLLANSRPSLAVRTTSGAVFQENGASAWTNPYNTDVWSYNLALAKEIAAMGFDEIQFDYIRFPGRVKDVYYGTDYSEETRVAAIRGFLARAQKELRLTGVYLSADVFGLTTATDDDQHTGQRLRDLGPYLDYISPMVYPDVWESPDLVSRGLGISNCADAVRCPYEVIYNSYRRAAEKTPTKIRLWLQAYPGRGDFGLREYRLQKKAASDAGSFGWMFWNAAGTYDARIFSTNGS